MNAETLIRTVPEEYAGQRLDQALARLFPEYSRSRLKSWLLDGAVLVDGGSPRPRDPVIGGETVSLKVPSEPAVAAAPEPMSLDAVYEDQALLVINKPAGLVVHPGAGNHKGTLLNGLLHHAPELEGLPRAGIVHRLDKDTSGLLVVARTDDEARATARDRETPRPPRDSGGRRRSRRYAPEPPRCRAHASTAGGSPG